MVSEVTVLRSRYQELLQRREVLRNETSKAQDDMEEDGEIVEEPTVIEIDSSSDSRKASIDNDKDRKKSKKNRRSRSRDRSRSNRFVKAK